MLEAGIKKLRVATMTNSLQDQLLNSGLVDEKKLKQHKRAKRKQAKQQGKGPAPVDEVKVAAQRALAVQAERGRELNKVLQQQAQQKAIAAQIVQLISSHRIERRGGDIAYQFADQGKIKKLQINDVLQRQLARGQIAIVRLAEDYQLIPAAIAAKISERDAEAVLVMHQSDTQDVDEDDPYADYPIPDDLMW
jgi:hypothetical protein